MRYLSRYLSVIIFLFVWQVFSVYIFPHFNPMAGNILPSFFDVIKMGADLFRRGELLGHIYASLFRVIKGFSLAVLIGSALGALMGMNKPVRDRLKILILMLRPIPPFAWIPLGLLWFGIGEAEMVMIIFIAGVFPVALHTLHGIKNIDPRLKQTAMTLGSARADLFRRVIIPALLPEWFSGLRLALGFSWAVVVGAEIVGSVSGLGYLILDSRNRGLPQMAVLGMLLIGLAGLFMDYTLVSIEKKVLPWYTKK